MDNIITSKQYTLDWRDAGKGLIVAIGTAILPLIQESLGKGPINWQLIGTAGISAGIVYLLKNFFTPSRTVIKNQINS